MRHTPGYVVTDPEEIKRLIRENPWATIVSSTSQGIVASHYPMILEEGDEISMVSHFGRPDELLHELGASEILVIIQGPHGYISSGWYDEGDFIPTWNHVTAHLYGTPEILSEEENFRVLGELVHHFEDEMPHPVTLEVDEGAARRSAKGTVGLRLRVTRFEARFKLSQNKCQEVADRIIDELQGGEHYSSPHLAREMRRVHGDAAR
jgi:transcriptional regulator